MMLGSSLSMTSPRSGGSSPRRSAGPGDVRKTFRECLSAPTELMSFTFCKLSLLPALQRPPRQSTKCDSCEFFLSVLSEFVASFLDVLCASGNLPVSRKNWQLEQEEGLQLERENRKQKEEFRIWSGHYEQSPNEAPVPSSVDLLQRPDCLDDVFALAMAVAALGPEYALKFWSRLEQVDENEDLKFALTESRALKKIQSVALDDESLVPFYLSFLAALAKAEHPETIPVSGANIVHTMMLTAGPNQWSWNYVMETLRWYVRQFSDSKITPAPANTGSAGTPSTSYYYYSNLNPASSSKQSNKSKVTSKPAELGEANTFYLLSLLNLISSVAARAPASRLEILGMKLPVTAENSTTIVANDPTLNILFSLATAQLPPEIRGATFTAIASLLYTKSCKEEDAKKIREFAASAWELVESCQVLPIILLDQYPQATNEELTRHISGMKFPVTSLSLVS
jgi:hypothetical protein